MIGSTIAHYTILEKLGEGGMGIVYKARDSRLDRFVALKFLPPHVSRSEQEKNRFLQEARSASALNHPNVCTVYGIGEHDGQQYIELELVEGRTLRDVIAASSPLPMKQVLEYALQMADALQEAHSKGIVHRDIKAENIMVNAKDQIKVMDFGLAKLKGSLKLTRTSSTIGTLAYMSPEQIQGREADPRSDLFSFGVVLFEMVTGRMPFRGEHEAAVMYSIVNEEPEDAARYRSDLPEELKHLLKKALEKEPEDRYQSMADLMVDLRRLKKETTRIVRTSEFRTPATAERPAPSPSAPLPPSHIALSKRQVMIGGGVLVLAMLLFVLRSPITALFAGPERKVIAVLPFENLGPVDKQYFVDGMTDEVTSRLSGLSGLKVIARTSAMQYKNSPKPLKQIGAELGVNYILQGTVRWETIGSTTNVRVNPTLIRVDDETQLWSVSIESVLSSAFKLQSDIASKVAGAMNVVTASAEKTTLTQALTNDAEAYDLYLRGSEYVSRVGKDDMEIGIGIFEKAVARDPSFAAAYAKMAKTHAAYYWFFYDRSPERIRKARENAERALQLAPELSEAHEAMGWFYYHTQLDYANALREFDLALKYRPSNDGVLYGIAAVKRRQGDMAGSIASFQRSIEENPRASDVIRQLGETQTLARRYEEAEQNYQRATDLSPEALSIYWDRIQNFLLWKGDVASAKRVLTEAKRFGRPEDMPYIVEYGTYILAVYERNFSRADSTAAAFPNERIFTNQFYYHTASMLRGELALYRGRRTEAVSFFTKAAKDLEPMLRASPDDGRLFSAYGIALAGLGRTDEAVKAGEHAAELMPYEKEAWRGASRLEDLARIYAMCGRADDAFRTIDRLLSRASEFSEKLLLLDPVWEPLRSHPRFQSFVKG